MVDHRVPVFVMGGFYLNKLKDQLIVDQFIAGKQHISMGLKGTVWFVAKEIIIV